MESIMELLVKKKHPEYTCDEIWEEIRRFCENNELKIKLFLKRFHYETISESFGMLRHQVMSLLCGSSDGEVQRVFREITNFEQGMLVLLANKTEKERVYNNMTNRLISFIDAEAYIIAHKLSLDETMFERVLRKVLTVFCSEEMVRYKRELWTQNHSFHIVPNGSKVEKLWVLWNELPEERVARWSKSYEPLRIKIESYLFHDYEINQCRTIMDLMKKGEYRKGLEASYQYSVSGKGNVSMMISGLVLNEKEEIVFLSYLVRQQRDKKQIYRVRNDVETFPHIEEELTDISMLEEVTEEDFLFFCKALYGRQYD